MQRKSARFPAALLCAMLACSVCAAQPAVPYDSTAAEARSAAHDDVFNHWVAGDLAERVKADPRYRRIPLDTGAAVQQFTGWLHALYRQRMTPQEFRTTVLKMYPGHEYEVDFIILALPPAARR
ncbi:MAG TPA: hypothetical protein PKC97_12355 [Burkholderiaceae bacterium]|nr:hypothetical protein [Burkholderiaceae bacterium]